MLSSNSVIPPQITQGSTRAAVAETERSDVSASSNGNDEPEPTKQESDEQQAFEDNPGKLPDDAVKSTCLVPLPEGYKEAIKWHVI